MSRFTVELTVTNRCSFRCDYCFESDFKEGINCVNDRSDEVIRRLRNLIESREMENVTDSFNITFWGGEPTLNYDLIYKVVDTFTDYENVTFFTYTNGSRIREMIPSLLRGGKKFRIQISYDGYPIHDMRRKSVSGHPTSVIVLSGMDILKAYDIPFHLKGTITYKDFKYISSVWDDFYNLRMKYGKNIYYGLTVDYHNITFEDYKTDVEKGLIEVARKEYKFFLENKEFLSNLFNDEKRLCNTSRMITIDTHGDMYPCHGCIYSSEGLSFGNFFKNDYIKKIKENHDKFSVTPKINDECSNCIALRCTRCNVKKFELSDKKDFMERWTDFTVQEDLCNYYKLCGKIGRGLHKALRDTLENGRI